MTTGDSSTLTWHFKFYATFYEPFLFSEESAGFKVLPARVLSE